MNPIRSPMVALAALVAAGSVQAQQPPESGFLCCNMRSNGSWISDSNYQESGKRVIPFGTPIKLLGYGRYRVNVEIDGRREDLGNDYSRDLSMEAFAARYIVTKDPRETVKRAPKKVRDAIESMRVTKGMTREQVLIAVGYPISSENPSLDAREWRYWLWSFSPFVVQFDGNGRVSGVTADPDTRLKVYAN